MALTAIGREATRHTRVLLTLVLLTFGPSANAKTPGGTHCHGKVCHRVSTLEEMDASVGRTGVLEASFYDDCRKDRFNPCGLTSSGAVFRPDAPDNAASPVFPDGTVLLAYNPDSLKAAVVRVNSAGPYWGDRKLDVSRATAERLGFRHKGVAELMVAIVKSPEPHEARYKKKRTYDPVPGFIGAFESFSEAHRAALARLDLDFQTVAGMRPGQENADAGAGGARPSKAELFKHATFYLDAAAPAEMAPASVPAIAAGEVRDLEAALVLGADETSALPPGRVADARPDVIVAQEPDYSWEGLRQRFSVFVQAARYEARRHASASFAFSLAEVPQRLATFIEEARLKAQYGAAERAGSYYRVAASLRFRAQPQPLSAPQP